MRGRRRVSGLPDPAPDRAVGVATDRTRARAARAGAQRLHHGRLRRSRDRQCRLDRFTRAGRRRLLRAGSRRPRAARWARARHRLRPGPRSRRPVPRARGQPAHAVGPGLRGRCAARGRDAVPARSAPTGAVRPDVRTAACRARGGRRWQGGPVHRPAHGRRGEQRLLGAPHARPAPGHPARHAGDLRLNGGRLCMVLPSGRSRQIDVVYRRTDEDRMRDARGRPTWLADMLLEPMQRGYLGFVNAPGTGVADDKLVHAYVEDMIRFYLGEEPLIESVKTYDLTRSDTLTKVLGRLSGLVIKPRSGHGGNGVFIGAHATSSERATVAAALRAAPHTYVAQETIRLSRLPTVVDGQIEPRHVDLRVFTLGTGRRTTVLPAPLTRVALRRGSLIVNSSQGGGAKDTWIVGD